MPNLTQLRLAARDIFDETLRAVDAGEAVRRAVHLKGSQLTVQDATIELSNRWIYSIAIGKAALPMALALEDAIGERFIRGLIVGPVRTPEACVPPSRWQWREGGHPLPTKTSLFAAEEAFALLDRANKERALLIFLISGGGSAMLEWPIQQGIALADLRMANKVLINCGASIVEINSVRRAFSAVKGGRLAARAPNCDQITLIVSDVPSGQERNSLLTRIRDAVQGLTSRPELGVGRKGLTKLVRGLAVLVLFLKYQSQIVVRPGELRS